MLHLVKNFSFVDVQAKSFPKQGKTIKRPTTTTTTTTKTNKQTNKKQKRIEQILNCVHVRGQIRRNALEMEEKFSFDVAR